MDQQPQSFSRPNAEKKSTPFEKQIFPPQTNLLSNLEDLDLDKFKPMNPENSIPGDKENTGQKKAHFGSLFSLTKVRKPANTILNKIYKKMLSPDIIFSVHGEKFPAHKDILAYLEVIFWSKKHIQGGMKEAQAKEIEITDMSSQSFKVLLGFIYYEEPELTEDLAIELLKASDKYKLSELADSCEDFLIGNLTENNFVKIVQVAESIDNIKLKDAVLDFMAKNLETVRKREDLFDVSKSVLIDLLSKVKSK